MMPAKNFVPVDVYLHTTYRPECEYVEGDLLERNVGELPHSTAQMFFLWYFRNQEDLWQYQALPAQRIQVSPTRYECCTPMGKRLLRAQLLRPMQALGEINARLDAVGEAAADIRRREGLRRAMDGILDLERLLGRVALDSAGPREVVALGASSS